MKELTKQGKVIKWASEKRRLSFSNALKKLGWTSEVQLRDVLSSLERRGFITYKVHRYPNGKSFEVRLTQSCYYHRSACVPS